MRYILKRDNFLTKDKVNEVFKNELTWGGSLFGRLINSSIRKAKIEFKKAQIDEVLNQIEATIYEILRESLIKDDRVKYYRLLLKSKYAAIKDVSLANDPNLPDYDQNVDCSGGAGRTKFSELIGQDPIDTTTSDFTPKWRNLPSGLIDDLLNDIETLDEVGKLLTRDQKEKLRDIHSDFAVELRKCRWIKCNNKFPGGDEATKGFWQGKVPITDADKELKSEISVKNESLRNRRIFSKFSEFEMYKSFLESSKNRILLEAENTNTSKNKIDASQGGKVKLDQSQQTNIVSQLGDKNVSAGRDIYIISQIQKQSEEKIKEESQKIIKGGDINLDIERTIQEGDNFYRNALGHENNAKKLSLEACEEAKKQLTTPEDVMRVTNLVQKTEEAYLESVKLVQKLADRIKVLEFISKNTKNLTKEQKKQLSNGILGLRLKLDDAHKRSETSRQYYLDALKCFTDNYNVIINPVPIPPIPVPPIPVPPIPVPPVPVPPVPVPPVPNPPVAPPDPCKVSELWKLFFERSESKGKDLEPLLRLSRDDEKELADLQSRLNAGTLTLNYNIASDAIIRLLNLLYTAYDIFATEYIPSGRPGGRVSLKTFQEYQKLDQGTDSSKNATRDVTDAGGTAVIPGFGPWAINVVYKKFQRRMRALHEDQELRKIFANVNFNYPGSEDKFNDSYKYSQSRLQKLNEADKGSLENRKMGPVLFTLLADLTNPRMCNPQKIDAAWRKYFGQEPLPETAKRESNENSASNKETPESKGLPYLSWIDTSGKIKSKGSYCIPSKEGTFDIKKIDDRPNGLLENRTGPSAPIYITLIDSINPISTRDDVSGKLREFLPVKITFKTPSVANQYYKDNTSKYSGYADYTDERTPEPNIYYGYCAMNSSGSEYWIFYVPINDYECIHYQKLKIESQKFNDRRNPNAENPPKREEKLINYSILKGGTTGPQLLWDDFRDALRYKSDDNANVTVFFERNIGKTSIPFEDYMISLLDQTKPANKDRIEEICK